MGSELRIVGMGRFSRLLLFAAVCACSAFTAHVACSVDDSAAKADGPKADRGTPKDSLEGLLDGAEKALDEARKLDPPGKAAVRKAEADLRSAQERVKDALLRELLPAVRKLEAERDEKKAEEVRPIHPDRIALVGRIVTQRNRLWRLGRRIRAGLSETDRKALGLLPPLTLDLGDEVRMEFVVIPPGRFQMGSNDGNKDEQPAHRVCITKPFYLGKYEVTQEQWQAVMGKNPSRFKGAGNPVECVSWFDSKGFLEKLAAKVPKGFSCRLPTEAEWEYACRAGTTTKYSFGNDEAELADHAWYEKNSGKRAHPVGEKKPNPWGLYDMYGNCWEWCQDLYADSYPAGEQMDPTGSKSAKVPVLRGGSWFRPAEYCRSARRYKATPNHRNGNLGFRVLLRGVD